MSTTRVASGGTKLRSKSSGSWADVCGITDIAIGEIATGVIDTTELDPYCSVTTTPAPTSYELIKTFAAGWTDAGEIAMEGNFTQASFAAVLASQLIGDSYLVAVHFRNGYAFVCEGFVTGLSLAAQAGDELVKQPFKLKLTGKPVMVTHAAANAL